MAGDKARRRRAQSAKLLLDERNEFFDQGTSAGSIIGRVGEDVMTQTARGIKDYPEHFDAGHVRTVGHAVGHEVSATEAGNFVNDRILLLRHGGKRFWQHDAGAHLDWPFMEIREQLT